MNKDIDEKSNISVKLDFDYTGHVTSICSWWTKTSGDDVNYSLFGVSYKPINQKYSQSKQANNMCFDIPGGD